ncbi:MAG: hypothetical protein GAK37_00680 [Pseudomonas sp.]|nr:MAG: hypothetical protein GAK37_00680 [Pseudomonas sp.]
MFLDLIRKLYIQIQIFSYSKEGASGIEYALVAAMVAVVIGAFITPISTAVKGIFTSLQTNIHT